MRNIIILFSFLAIIGIAAAGILYIFEWRTWEQTLDLLLKTEGVILLLAICSAAISLLLGSTNKQTRD
jgi:hypothetical protein